MVFPHSISRVKVSILGVFDIQFWYLGGVLNGVGWSAHGQYSTYHLE